jgi:hypothetical protein
MTGREYWDAVVAWVREAVPSHVRDPFELAVLLGLPTQLRRGATVALTDGYLTAPYERAPSRAELETAGLCIASWLLEDGDPDGPPYVAAALFPSADGPRVSLGVNA